MTGNGWRRDLAVATVMRMLDLFCGRWGWGRAFAARGHLVVGMDLVKPESVPNGCRFILQDILTLTPDWMREAAQDFDFMIASSPCENFSLFQIRNFHPEPPYPELGIKLFKHTEDLCKASGLPYVMENVRAAQDFVGPAVAHSGSFYLWGNAVPPLLPKGLTKGMKMDRQWCQELGGHGSSKRNSQTAGFATIPPELANCVADYAERLLELQK
jgi:hypothetical protein